MKHLLCSIIVIIVISFTNVNADELWGWGSNSFGQLGEGENNTEHLPIQVGSSTNWSQISVFFSSSYAIKSDGTLWAWGDNYWGQLGDGTNTDKHIPTQIGTSSIWTKVSGGTFFALGIKSDGSLWAWGNNAFGQLGDGTNTNKNSPTQIGTSNNWSQISTGTYFTLAIKTDGTLWTWGNNGYGQLGNGTYSDKNIPTQIGNSTNWSKISAGYNHSIAIKSDGTLWTWGSNYTGQLGDGTNTDRITPVKIGNSTNWSKVSAGFYHSLAIKTDGTLWAWGANSNGQLGDATNTNKNAPIQIGTSTNWSQISAGSEHSSAIKTDGTLWAWGANSNGQLGDGTDLDKNIPTQIGISMNCKKATCGLGYILALGESISAITTSVSNNQFCMGSSISISYNMSKNANSGNIFIAQLSDALGSFSNPVIIGTLTSSSSGTGTIIDNLPSTISPGTGYRARVVSSNPVIIGSDNGSNIAINSLPKPVINGSNIGCAKSFSIYSIAKQQGHSYKWSLIGDGIINGSDNNNTIEVDWSGIGQASIQLIETIDATGCQDSAKMNVTLYELPKPDFSAQDTACSTCQVKYFSSDNSNFYNYWQVTNGIIIDNELSPTIIVKWDSIGVGTLKLIQTNRQTGCRDSINKNILIYEKPKVEISGPNIVCMSNKYLYSGINEPDTKFKWFVTGGNIINGDTTDKLEVIWKTEGIQTINQIKSITTKGFKDSISYPVTVNALPKVEINGSEISLDGETKEYNSNSSNVEYQWISENGTILGNSKANIVKVKWGNVGDGKIKLIITDNTTLCKDSLIKQIKIKSASGITISGRLTICENESEQYSFESNSGEEYLWSIINGNLIGDNNTSKVNVKWGKVGNGAIILIRTILANNKRDTVKLDVKLNPIPEKPSISKQGLKLISSSTTGNQWYLNGEILKDSTKQEIFANIKGVYQVEITISDCRSEKSDSLLVDPTDVLEISLQTLSFVIKPNPASDIIEIEFTSPDCSNTEISIYSSNGNLVDKITDKLQSLSGTKISYNASKLSSGEYTFTMTCGNEKAMRKVFVMK
jgi:alpha-tubulin suppressor-like RCC1 family protein